MERAIVTRDPVLREVLALAERIAPRRGPVMIEGERGTGKSLLARHLHALGGAARPYVVVDCAMRPAAALARELFGADDGGEPSTGAIAAARGGTLVLDEVCDLDAALQTRLLRTLEDEWPLEVRLVATSRRPLAATVASGAFRDDLWTRLSVVTLAVPPLRARRDDVEVLAEHILARVALGRAPVLSAAARATLRARAWPGNVRELEHAVERAALLATGPTIDGDAFAAAGAESAGVDMGGFTGVTVREMERRLILETLRHTRHNRTRAARLLGISIRTLRNKLGTYRRRGLLDPGAPAEAS
jgi:DNA-binding NtrC family response regulator